MTALTGAAGRQPPPAPQRRAVLNRRVRRLAWATIIYNTGEGVVAVVAGLAAGSVALVGFGLDSAVEVLSAVAVSWQFNGRADARDRERAALRLIAISFFALAAYVTADALANLLSDRAPPPSTPTPPRPSCAPTCPPSYSPVSCSTPPRLVLGRPARRTSHRRRRRSRRTPNLARGRLLPGRAAQPG